MASFFPRGECDKLSIARWPTSQGKVEEEPQQQVRGLGSRPYCTTYSPCDLRELMTISGPKQPWL